LVWRTLIKGVKGGLSQFLNVKDLSVPPEELAKGAINRILDLLGNVLEIPDLPGLVSEIVKASDPLIGAANVALKLVGYDWDSILALVGEIAGPYGAMAVGFIGTFIGEVEDKGLWEAITGIVHQAEQWVGDVVGQIKALPEELLNSVIQEI